MPLTVTTDLTILSSAETFAAPWVSWGSGGAGAAATETDFFAQGTACISRGVTGAVIKGATYDNTTGLDFTTTHNGKLIYFWLRNSTPGLSDTRAAGGLRIVLASGATTPGDAAGVWSAWYVDGSDTILSTEGWKCYVIDPNSTPSTTFGGGVNKAAIRWFAGVMKTTATAKGQNFGIDQIAYGFGTLRVRGANTVVGQGFKEIADADFGTIGNRYGIVTVKDGIIFCQGRIELGDNISTNVTTFTSQDENVVFTRPTYYDGTREAECIPDARPDGTPYLGIVRVGNATNNTDVTIGVKVGTGATAKGRSGGSIIGSRIRTGIACASGTIKATSIFQVYGAAISNCSEGINLSANLATDEWIGGSVTRCGTLQPGPVVIRGTNFINGLGGSYKFFEDFRNDAIVNEALATADPRTDWANAVGGTQLVVPAGLSYVRLDAAAAVRNVVKINKDAVGSDDHYVDAVINFPTGSNQGVMGVFIRASSTLATENYWFLQLDRPNSQISLIRVDAGVDTTVVGPTAFTIAADTDYLVHLRGSGTTIEGFVNGTKLSTTSATYQTNRWIGIRGTANNSQSASAEPRISRFGCGPITNKYGAITLVDATTPDIENVSIINCNRALTVEAVSTAYLLTGFTFTGNSVGVRNASNGAVTITAVGQSPETTYENLGSATTTVNNNVALKVTCKNLSGLAILGVNVRIQRQSDGSLIDQGSTDSLGVFNSSFNYSVDLDVKIVARLKGYKNNAAADTILSTGLSVPFTMLRDETVSLP